MNLYDKIFKPKIYTLPDGSIVKEKRSRAIVIAPLVLLLLILSAQFTQFSFARIIKQFHQMGLILKDLFNPDFRYLPKVVDPLIETIKMSLLGSFLGAVFSIPFAYIASSNMMNNKFVNWIMRTIFSIMRTIPTIVNALIATFIFGIGSKAGTVAIFIYSFSYVGKIIYEQIENVEMGAFEALISMGYKRYMAFIKAVLPQVLPTFFATALYNFEGNVRYAAILGYVGAGGVGILIKHNIGLREYSNLGAILLLVLITIVIIEGISLFLRKKFVWGKLWMKKY